MMRTRRLILAIAVALLVLASWIPTAALAIPANATVVSTHSETVSGAQIASDIMRNLDRVALGSKGATVTLNVAGEPHDVALDLTDVSKSALGRSGLGGSGLGGVAVLAAIGAAVMRGAAMLVRLSR